MTHSYALTQGLRLPILASPMFLVSNPEMVIAQCRSGIVGSFPALSYRVYTINYHRATKNKIAQGKLIGDHLTALAHVFCENTKIGRASCRERV